MRRAVETSQLMGWLCRRYVRFIFVGAALSCGFFNMALHSIAGLQFYCEQECFESYMIHPLGSMDPVVIEYIKDHYVDPPHPRGSYKPDFPLENPPWSSLGKWGEAHTFVSNYFDNYKVPGKFIEIGAQDGEFMSFTLWLEQVKNFTGLLVEPNKNDYVKLRKRGRSSYSINACASNQLSHHKDILWLRDVPENLPELLRRVQEGSNRLVQYVTEEDRELGQDMNVQCFNIGAMAKAALSSLVIDFMSISTHGGECDIITRIPTNLHIRMLLVVVPLATSEEADDIKELTKKKGLVEASRLGNIHIFIPKEEVRFA